MTVIILKIFNANTIQTIFLTNQDIKIFMEVHHSLGTSTDWIVMVLYFIAIMGFGAYFSKYNRTTTDFFFGGRRFAWWLIAMSIVATGVGSHSFIKYSAKGFDSRFFINYDLYERLVFCSVFYFWMATNNSLHKNQIDT